MKDYWKNYSSVEIKLLRNFELFINTTNGNWGLFIDDVFEVEGLEGEYPNNFIKEMYESFE